MKVAIVHDWLVSYRGGEQVLEAICKMFPEAPIFTLFYDPRALPESLRQRDIRYPSLLNRLRPLRRLLLPILPHLVEGLPVGGFDCVISTSSCVAKGIIPGPNAKHICYIHSPMRYVWDQAEHYLKSIERIPGARLFMKFISHRLRIWDVTSSHRVDHFVANSSFVANRVARYYNRNATVVHPPVRIHEFINSEFPTAEEEYYLVAGAFVPYKRFDLAIAACERLGKKLVVAGSGPEEANLRRIAGPNTKFAISPDRQEWIRLMCGARALLFPALEDFGIVAIEAMASGTPVIAYREGGAKDFIQPEVTGLMFDHQTIDSLCDSLRHFSTLPFDAQRIRAFALQFSEQQFLANMKREIDNVMGTEKC